MLVAPIHVPPMPRGHAADGGLRLNRIGRRGLRQPIEERLPDFPRLLCVQADLDHADPKLVVRGEVRLLAPVIVEKGLVIETYELADEPPIGIV